MISFAPKKDRRVKAIPFDNVEDEFAALLRGLALEDAGSD